MSLWEEDDEPLESEEDSLDDEYTDEDDCEECAQELEDACRN